METHPYRYIRIAHAQPGADIGIVFEREGVEFVAVLSVEDARQLLHDLPEQVRIAGSEAP